MTVSKKIPLTVSMITDKELDKELAMMEKAKEHYFDGINDGKYADKDSITGNLHAFCEMSLDEQGNPVWAYDVNDKTGTGIIPDDYQDGSLGQTGWPYNRFKSSNNAIVTHENLLVTRRKTRRRSPFPRSFPARNMVSSPRITRTMRSCRNFTNRKFP